MAIQASLQSCARARPKGEARSPAACSAQPSEPARAARRSGFVRRGAAPPPPLLLPPPRRQHLRRRPAAGQVVAAAADASASEDGGQQRGRDDAAAGADGWVARRAGGLAAHLLPLKDPAANRQLLALCGAQMLSFVASDLHDLYLPLFQRDVLKMSNTSMGAQHAMLQLLPPASGILSGRLSDLLGPARLVIAGNLITACLCKPMFALCGPVNLWLGAAACTAWIAFAKVLDRTVKGLRETPSKALIGELAAQSGESATGAFSLRQALSTLGMLLGSAAAFFAFQLSGRSYQATFALSTIPALAGAALAAAFLRDSSSIEADSSSSSNGSGAGGSRASREGPLAADAAPAKGKQQAAAGVKGRLGVVTIARLVLRTLQPGYWQALGAVCLLHLARYDIAFVSLRASTVMDKASLPSLRLFSMIPVILLATPVGLHAKSSVAARNRLLLVGCTLLVAGNLTFAFAPSALGMACGSTLLGLHIALTQGTLFGMLAAYIPSRPLPGIGRIGGTVWSLTDVMLGVSMAAGNALAGLLTDWTLRRGWGGIGAFLGASLACTASALALLAFSTWGQLGSEHAAPEGAS